MGLKHPPQTSCPRERKGFGILNPNCPRERERDLEYSTKLPKGEKGIWNTQPSCPRERKGFGILNQVALRGKKP